MSAVGEAFVEIRPDSGGFASTLARQIKEALGPAEASAASEGRAIGQKLGSGMDSEIKPAMAKVQGTIGSSLKTIASFAQYYLGYQLVGAISQVPLAAVKVAGAFQQTQIAFTGLLGSATDANAFLKQLQQFAAATPFEFPQLTKAAQQLLAVGNNAKDIIPIMTTIGNVASALGVSGDEINHVVLALGQIKGAGVVHMQDLLQISNALPGFSAVAAIASERGESVAQAYNDIGKGAVPADEGIKAILDGMNKFPGSAGAMQRQSLTLNGVVSTLKDNLRNVAIDFITPKLPALSSAVQKFGDLVQHTFSGNIKQAAADLGSLFGQGPTSTFTKAIDRIGESFSKLAPVIGDLIERNLKVLGVIIGGLLVTFSYFVEGLAAAAEALTNPKKALDDFGVAGTIAATALGVLVVAISSIAVAEGVATQVIALQNAIKTLPTAAADAVVSIKKLAQQISGLTSKTVSIAQKGAEGATSQVGKLVDAIKGLSDKTVTVSSETKTTGADKAKAGITGAITGAAGGIAGVIGGAIDLSAISTALAGVGSVVAAAIFSVPALIAAAVGAVAIIGFYFRKGIVHFFSDTLPRLVTEQIPHAFAGAGPAIGSAIEDAFRAVPHLIGEALGAAAGLAVLAIAGLIAGIVTAIVKGVPAVLGVVGKLASAISGGLGSGLSSGLGVVSSFVDSVVGFFERLPGLLGKALAVVISTVAKAFQDLTTDPIGTLINFQLDVYDIFAGILTGIIKAVVQIPGIVGGALTKAQQLADQILSTVASIFQAAFSAILSTVASALIRIGSNIASAFGSFLSGVTDGWNRINSATHGQLDRWVGDVGSFLGAAVGLFASLPGRILGALGDVGGLLIGAGRAIIGGLIAGISSELGGLESLARSLYGRVVGAAGNFGSVLLEAGKDVIRSLIHGIDAMIGPLVDKMTQVAKVVTDHLPRSPAKRGPMSGRGYPLYAGQAIVRSLAEGMTSQLPALAGATSDIVGPLQAAIAGIGPSAGRSIGANGTTRNNHYNLTLNTARSASDVATQFGWMELAGLGGGS